MRSSAPLPAWAVDIPEEWTRHIDENTGVAFYSCTATGEVESDLEGLACAYTGCRSTISAPHCQAARIFSACVDECFDCRNAPFVPKVKPQ